MLSRAVEVTSVEGCFVCRGYECRGLDSSRQYLDSSLDSHADLQHADLQIGSIDTSIVAGNS